MAWRPDEALEAMLTSCSNKQLRACGAAPGRLIECMDAVGGPGNERKRSFYSCFDTSEPANFDDEYTADESLPSPCDKKSRRLGFEQVKALEKAFDIENRLDPDRKVRLANELGLQPRQVAVWFQNRRARWKTKQMERDYGVLKNKFEILKADWDELFLEKEKLQAEVARLKIRVKSERSLMETTDPSSPSDHPPASSLENTTKATKTAAIRDDCEDPILAEGAATSPNDNPKENDSFSSTDDSEDSAIVDSGSRDVEEDQTFVEEEEHKTLDDPEFYHSWRSQIALHRQIKDEEDQWVAEEDQPVEDGLPFQLPLEWTYW